jgi:HSP20 family protein
MANPLNVKKTSVWRPAVEVKQNDDNYKIKVQLPGVEKDDIEVELDNDFITITAEIHEEKEESEQNKKYYGYAKINGKKYLVKDLLNNNPTEYNVTIDILEEFGLEFIKEEK